MAERKGAADKGSTDDTNHTEQVMISIDSGNSNAMPLAEPCSEQGQLSRDSNLSAEMASMDVRSRMTVHFANVCSWVPNLGLGEKGNAKKHNSKSQILFNVTAGVAPGEVLALMGPSGSGKTSLLSILGGRTQREVEVKGEVLFNGRSPTRNLKRKMGFVLQDDLMFASLTVWETLWYAAQLRLPESMSYEERRGRVCGVVSTLGLQHCVNTIIGGFGRRGISGGERKRVNVGHEMIINPSVLFLDEPTSGLDSTTALSLVHTLRDLAMGGRTIITTIHQPSSRMYKQLDKLLLLSKGHVMYYGDAQVAGTWFAKLDAPCPFGVSLADHILDMASGSNNASTPEGQQKLWQMQLEAYQDFKAKDDFDLMTGFQSLETHATQWKDSRFPSLYESQSTEASTAEAAPSKRWACGWLKQVRVLTARSFKVNRFERVNSQTVGQMVAIAVITGLLWFQRAAGTTKTAARDTTGLLFFELLFTQFQAMFSALFAFPSQMQQLRKERASGMYRLSAFYTSKILGDLPLDLLLPTLGVFILYFLAGLRLEAAAFFANWFTILLVVLTAQGFGMVLSAGFAQIKTAQTLATIIVLTFMLVGGFYVVEVPGWIRWLRYLSWIYYGYNIVMHIQFSGRAYTECAGPGCGLIDLQQVLALTKDPNSSIALDIGVLLLLFVAFRIAVYFVLNARTKSAV